MASRIFFRFVSKRVKTRHPQIDFACRSGEYLVKRGLEEGLVAGRHKVVVDQDSQSGKADVISSVPEITRIHISRQTKY